MTITYFQEMAKSRDAVIDLRAGSTTFNYMALVVTPYDVSDDQDVIAYANANTSVSYGFQQKRTINLTGLGGPAWQVTVIYGFDEGDAIPLPPGDALGYEFSFDTTGGTQHITQSLTTMSATKYGVPVTERTVTDLVTIAPRTVNDAVTTLGTNILTSATAAFTSKDLGAVLTSTTVGMLPVTVTITQVTSGTAVLLSSAALGTQAAGNLTISSVIIQSATAAFVANDVGANVTSPAPVLPVGGANIRVVVSATQAQISGGTIRAATSGTALTIGGGGGGGRGAINYNRAIGVSRDGVAGTDVTVPKLEFQMIRDFQGMTMDYIRTVRALTGRKNDAVFFGFEPGELLFLGASGAPSQNNQAAAAPLCRVTFRFAASSNVEDLDLVPDDASGNHLLRVASKRGWDYLWVFYKDDVDPVSNTMRPRPDAAYVEEVALDGDFSELLIGTS